MKKYRVIFSPKAMAHMQQLGLYIASKAGEKIALNYIARIYDHCDSLKTFPYRGTVRDDLHPNTRIIGYRRNVNIAFTIHPDKVIIQGVFSGGQDIDKILADK